MICTKKSSCQSWHIFFLEYSFSWSGLFSGLFSEGSPDLDYSLDYSLDGGRDGFHLILLIWTEEGTEEGTEDGEYHVSPHSTDVFSWCILLRISCFTSFSWGWGYHERISCHSPDLDGGRDYSRKGLFSEGTILGTILGRDYSRDNCAVKALGFVRLQWIPSDILTSLAGVVITRDNWTLKLVYGDAHDNKALGFVRFQLIPSDRARHHSRQLNLET
jgi:hypothetical protein